MLPGNYGHAKEDTTADGKEGRGDTVRLVGACQPSMAVPGKLLPRGLHWLNFLTFSALLYASQMFQLEK